MPNMNIQFLFFDDKVCGRCKDTEASLFEAVKEFKTKYPDFNIKIQKQKLTQKEIKKSPTILVDEVDIESYLFPAYQPAASHCQDCSCLTGETVSCRTYGENKSLTKKQILGALERHIIRIPWVREQVNFYTLRLWWSRRLGRLFPYKTSLRRYLFRLWWICTGRS